MKREYRALLYAVERGRESFLDPYGATSECEFFAVATEVFFERPEELGHEDPELYELLSTFYRQDPARDFMKLDSASGLTGRKR